MKDDTMQDARFILQESTLSLVNYSNVRVFRCNYLLSGYHEDLFSQLGIEFVPSLKLAVPKRQAEFLAGRYMAKQALADFGYDEQIVAVGPHRSPIWPKQVVGSITHTHKSAVCAMAYKSTISALGVDLEMWLNRKVALEIKSNIIDEGEASLLAEADFNLERAVTLIFSAKESLFKALYPDVGQYFDFDTARIIAMNGKKKCFTFQLQETLSEQFKEGYTVNGNFIDDGDSVLTVIAIRS